jgi:hypothetical protein
MATKVDPVARLARLTEICLALPEASRQEQGAHPSFLVRKKVFAYYLNNHHGDNIVGVCCKVLPGENQLLIDANPRKFVMPAYIGPRGWVELRLDLASIDWQEVAQLVHGSYLQIAPKKLCALVEKEDA